MDSAFIIEMENACLDKIHIDLKAYSTKLHEWYTGESNQRLLNAIALLNKSDLNLEVMTVFIPGIIDKEETEKIAEFLSDIGDIRYMVKSARYYMTRKCPRHINTLPHISIWRTHSALM